MNFAQLSFGIFSLKIYGILIALAFVVSSYHFYHTLKKKSVLVDFFLHHYWRWVLGGIVVGRLVAVALEPSIILENGIYFFFAFWKGGINFLGTLFGFLGIARWDLKVHGYTFSQWIDLAIPSMLIGIIITDLAAFLTGATYGKETALPWGVQYETFGVDILNPVHPVSLYALIIHVWLLYWTKARMSVFEKIPEKLAIWTGLLFLSADFLLRFLYGDEAYLVFGYLRWEQVLDLFCIVFLIWRGRKKGVF